jgi:hypothetical protein
LSVLVRPVTGTAYITTATDSHLISTEPAICAPATHGRFRVLVLDGPRARGSGPAFALGWVAGLTIVSVLVVLITGAASDPGSDAATGVDWLMAGIGLCFS